MVKQKIDTFDFFLIIAVAICFFYASHLYWDEGDLFPITKRSIVPIQNDGTHFVVNYFFNSTVYSAQNKIYASVVAWPLEDFMIKHQQNLKEIDTVYIYFIGFSTEFDKITEDGVFPPILVMKKGEDGRFRGGPFEITYQEEGPKCVEFSIEKLTSTIDDCDEKRSVLTISSADSYLQHQNNKTVLALTWVFIAFGILAIREPLRNIFSPWFPKQQDE